MGKILQKIIGDYIADFYCPKSKLVIEVDGGQHYCIEVPKVGALGQRERPQER